MRLKTWLSMQGRSNGWLGRKIGCRPEVVRRWCLPPTHPNHRKPNNPNMAAIARITRGEVSPNDFHDLSAAVEAVAEAPNVGPNPPAPA